MTSKNKFSLLLVVIMLFLTTVASVLFYNSYRSWKADSPLTSSAYEGFGWAASQYVIELSHSLESLSYYTHRDSDVTEEQVITRLTVLSSRGNLFIEESEFNKALNRDAWTKATSTRLAEVANDAYALTEDGLTRAEALILIQRLRQIEPIANEFNVKQRLRDMGEINRMVKANVNLQSGFALVALLAVLSAIVLAFVAWKNAKSSRLIATMERDAAAHASRQIEMMRIHSRRQDIVVEEVALRYKIDNDKLEMDFTSVNIYPFLKSITYGGVVEDIAERLEGLKLHLDELKLKLALKSLVAMSSSRGDTTLRAYRSDTKVVIEVVDDGPTLQSTKRIWEASSSDANAAGDPAVSHYVVRALIEKMGGTVEYQQPSRGNCYHIELPLRRD